ncbi:Uncharacterised protein [uncultured Blautia sp.]|nr:hypothetical protein [uncultured Blautia sp.]SCH90377.1 Uncharacterised protein [uncultured Blautia sp.]
MYQIIISENTYSFLRNKNSFFLLEETKDLKCEKVDTEYIISFKVNINNVNDIYFLISFIYTKKPNENNRWIINNQEILLSDEQTIKRFLLKFEGMDNYPLNRYILSDIIKNNEIKNIQELRKLVHRPFSGILLFDQFDISRIRKHWIKEERAEYIKIEYIDVCIKNRYIVNDFEFLKGEINFSNCVIEGNIKITGSAKVFFSQCIIIGNVICINVSSVYFSSINVKQLMLYNSNFDILRMEYCKIYRFVLHSCLLNKLILHSNEFIEPYLTNLNIQDINDKINMSQFTTKNINERVIKRINKNKPIKIKNENDFYLTFMFRKPIIPLMSNEIAFDMVDIILTYGDLDKEHNFYSNMKYKKALYSNTKWRKLFIFLTGAFYIPSRWIWYLILNTLIFAGVYSGFPTIEFMNVIALKMERMDLWTALYYSISQIIGFNPTIFTASGVSQICTTIQSLLNTFFIANFFTSLVKKFIRDEV